MAADIFAKLGDIKGESLDSKHKDEIEVLSYSWGVSNTGSMAHGSGGGEGKATFHDLSFVHKIDKSSPNLLLACATGTHLKEATITHRKAGKEQHEYLIVKLNDVIITGVTHGGSRNNLLGATTLAQLARESDAHDLFCREGESRESTSDRPGCIRLPVVAKAV